MPESLCPTTGKISYPSKLLAVAAAVRITNKCGAYRRAYLCPECGDYHLTHKRLIKEGGRRKKEKREDRRVEKSFNNGEGDSK